MWCMCVCGACVVCVWCVLNSSLGNVTQSVSRSGRHGLIMEAWLHFNHIQNSEVFASMVDSHKRRSSSLMCSSKNMVTMHQLITWHSCELRILSVPLSTDCSVLIIEMHLFTAQSHLVTSLNHHIDTSVHSSEPPCHQFESSYRCNCSQLRATLSPVWIII